MQKKISDCQVGEKVIYRTEQCEVMGHDTIDESVLVGCMIPTGRRHSRISKREAQMMLQLITSGPTTKAYQTYLDSSYDDAFWILGPEVMVEVVGTATSTPSAPVRCVQCGEGNEYATPNQPNGTFVCYGCRRS